MGNDTSGSSAGTRSIVSSSSGSCARPSSAVCVHCTPHYLSLDVVGDSDCLVESEQVFFHITLSSWRGFM